MVTNDVKCRTVAVEEESVSASVTSSFRNSNEFLIYKSTEISFMWRFDLLCNPVIQVLFRFNIHDYVDRMCLFLHSGTVCCYKK